MPPTFVPISSLVVPTPSSSPLPIRNSLHASIKVQYLYEIELRRSIVPRIGDGEVGELHLMNIDEVREAMKNGEFKLSCNMTYLAFLIRHGYINAENEPHLPEICARLHRRHQLFIA